MPNLKIIHVNKLNGDLSFYCIKIVTISEAEFISDSNEYF